VGREAVGKVAKSRLWVCRVGGPNFEHLHASTAGCCTLSFERLRRATWLLESERYADLELGCVRLLHLYTGDAGTGGLRTGHTLVTRCMIDSTPPPVQGLAVYGRLTVAVGWWQVGMVATTSSHR